MRMTIEKALEWAYREELPREAADKDIAALVARDAPGIANAAGPMASWLDNPSEAVAAPLNRWGVVGVQTMFQRGPHPDAIQIGLAVDALAGEVGSSDCYPDLVRFRIEDAMSGNDTYGTQVLLACIPGDGWALWDEAWQKASQRMPRRLRDVLVRWALARPPLDWDLSGVAPAPVKDAYGNPQWFRMATVEARTHKGEPMPGQVERVELLVPKKDRRKHPDAYQKFRLEPCPLWPLVDRLTYAAWRAALDVLYEDLQGRLGHVQLMPSAEPVEPWDAWEEPERAFLIPMLARAGDEVKIKKIK